MRSLWFGVAGAAVLVVVSLVGKLVKGAKA